MELTTTGPAARRRPALVDAALYAGSALFAWITAATAAIPLQRSWGRLAVWAYLVGVGIALLLRHDDRASRRALAVAVMAGATIVPLVAAATGRSGAAPGAAAQSEVFIVEEAATAVVSGRDPYAQDFDSGPLASRPAPTRTHVPYPPGMFLFGLPAAVAGPGFLTDARVWFLIGSLAVAAPAIGSMRTDAEGRLRVFQVLFVLPTAAPLLATGGHDVPVAAVLLAAFVLADRRATDAAGVASGAAIAMRQTALLTIPFVLSLVPPGRRARFVSWAIAPVAVIVLPFVVWDPSAFVEDTVLFPLGLGNGPSSANTPTLGSLLISVAPGARVPITVGLVVAILATVGLLLRWRPSRAAAGASARAAAAFAVAIALAPAARLGYTLYPIAFAVWAFAFRRGAGGSGQAAPGAGRSTAARKP